MELDRKELIKKRKLEIKKLTFNQLKRAYIALFNISLQKTEMIKRLEIKP